MSTLTIALVTGSDGLVDLDATLQAARASITAYVAEREVEDGNIGDAVHAVFDTYKGASINMPALAGFVLQKLNVQPENFGRLEARVMDFIRTNSQGKTLEDKTVERPDSAFVVAKGKGGGCFRRSDRAAK